MTTHFEGLTPQNVTLFFSPTCGYCYRVFNALETMNLEISSENIRLNSEARDELQKGGGKAQVPALRIRDNNGVMHWLYESLDIIEFLRKHFQGAPD